MSSQRTLLEIAFLGGDPESTDPVDGQDEATCWDWALANGWIDTGGKR